MSLYMLSSPLLAVETEQGMESLFRKPESGNSYYN